MITAEFRNPEQEVEKLVEECQIIREALKEISLRVARIENRAKRAFPAAASRVASTDAANRGAAVTHSPLTPEQALIEFDEAVKLATTRPSDAERFLRNKTSGDLIAIARELGISFSRSKPSRREVQDALYSRIRESISLTRHTLRTA